MTGELIQFPRQYVGGQRWENWVDEPEVARHYKVSTRTVRRWRVAGMPSQLIGGQRRYRIGETERWHRKQRRSA